MKKAQLKMMETIAIMIVFFILLALGFGFWYKMTKASAVQEEEKLSALKIVQITQRAIFLPELQCSEKNVIRDSCFDKIKLGIFEGFDNLKKDD